MSSYIYETHLHTSTGSACGKSLGSEYIAYYLEKGYTGIIVTDHFFNGNTAIPPMPWKERVARFCEGYEITKREGDRQGLQVFFGWECRFDGDEYLVYGLDQTWLENHPEMMEWDHKTHYEKIKEAGGLVVQAHPFRERGYITEIRLHPFQCDAWEVCNAGNPAAQDQLAYEYARQHHIPMTAGSDIHKVGCTLTDETYGVAFPYRLNSIQDYVRAIKHGEGTLYTPNNSPLWDDSVTCQTPVFLHDANGKERRIGSLSDLFSHL